MKFNIERPPTEGENANERLSRLVSWLYILADELNATLANLGEENFSESARARLFEKKEEKDDKI